MALTEDVEKSANLAIHLMGRTLPKSNSVKENHYGRHEHEDERNRGDRERR